MSSPKTGTGGWRVADELRRRELAESIERTLFEEARRNELTIAYVRAAVLPLIALLDVLAYAFPATVLLPEYPASLAALSASWSVVAAAIAMALRRGLYHRSLRLAMPAVDAALVFLLFANALRALGRERFQAFGFLTDAGAACALLATMGALRLSRGATLVSTLLALSIFVALSLLAVTRTAHVFVGASILAGVGLLSLRLTEVVRRAVEGEVGRATLRRFLPDHVIRDAYRDPIALLTEPRCVDATILVSDLRGFTAMAEKLEPALVLEFLNEVQGALAAAVREHGGTVDKFMGDGLLAVFGAPEPAADHASRALLAARDMQRAIDALNERRAAAGSPVVQLGLGIHSGAVVTGCLGSGSRLEFTVIGDTVNAASRLEALTKEKGTAALVSGETARRAALPEGAALEPLGEVSIRGRESPLELHSLSFAPPRAAPYERVEPPV